MFHFLLSDTQTSMNVSVLKVTSVTPTLCVPTLKDPMSVAVSKALREMGKTVQVGCLTVSQNFENFC